LSFWFLQFNDINKNTTHTHLFLSWFSHTPSLHVYNITKKQNQINQNTTVSKYTQQHLKITKKIASGTVLENSRHLLWLWHSGDTSPPRATATGSAWNSKSGQHWRPIMASSLLHRRRAPPLPAKQPNAASKSVVAFSLFSVRLLFLPICQIWSRALHAPPTDQTCGWLDR